MFIAYLLLHNSYNSTVGRPKVHASFQLDERGLPGFLEDCVERGLFVAPGPSFGPYPTHVRLCFTASPPEVVERGVEVLASLLGR